jgi:hypothetical protein
VYRNANQGAFVYQDGADAKIYNNVFFGNPHGLIVGSQIVNATVMNNIFSNNTDSALYNQGTRGTLIDGYNCVDGIYLGAWQKTGNNDAAPLFVDPVNGDFRLSSSSPCIDAGIDLNLLRDAKGDSPYDVPAVPNTGSPGDHSKDYVDMGAYEYVP